MMISTFPFLVFCFLVLHCNYVYCWTFNPGYYNYGGTTCVCNTGRYCPGDGSIVDCPYATFQPNMGSTSCIPCPTGCYTVQTGRASSNDCSPCPAGKYFNSSTPDRCQNCPAGTANSFDGRDNCPQCGVGYWSLEGAFTCQPCPAGTFSTLAGNPDSNYCIHCYAGTYSSVSAVTSCTPCPAGTYVDIRFQVACFPCPDGTVNTMTGANSSSNCTPCPVGQYPASSKTSCLPCAAGTYGDPAGTGKCLTCPVDTVNLKTGSSTLSDCIPCEAGSCAPAGGSACTVCLAGTYAPTTGSTGYCISCPAGTYSAAVKSTKCIIAPAGNCVPSAGLTGLTPCSAGTYYNLEGCASLSSCMTCIAGAYCPQGSGNYIPCQPGYFNSITGKYDPADCQQCSAGTNASAAGTANCGSCPAGYYADKVGSTTCTPCPPGTACASTGATALGSCIQCTQGNYSPGGIAACLQCQGGTYAGQTGMSTCTLCLAGTSSATLGATDSSSCQCCPAGSTSAAGSTTCTQCVAGKYSASCDGTCTNCPAGSYSTTAGTVTCIVSPSGTYIDTVGATSYILCPVGKYNPITNSSSSSNCLPCPAGFFSNIAGCYSCTPCPIGYFNSLTGQTGCLPCPVRYFQNLTGQASCPPCEVGTYNVASAQTSCTPCIPGTMQNQTGQITCFVCPKGTYQTLFRQISCIDCPTGYYQNYVGQAKCFACKNGTYSDINGSYGCKTCIKGSYQKYEGQSACNLCPAGSYQENDGQSECKLCTPGTYQEKIGQRIPCKKCPAGTVNPMWGGNSLASCHECSQASYQYLEGQADCVNCSKSFCGPCQFTDRTLCDKMKGICWVDYKNFSVIDPLNTTDCLKAMAPLCYKIWSKTDTTDKQCLDFVKIFDYSKMKTKIIIKKVILSSDGLYINVHFDNPVLRSDFTDCSTVFSQDTLNWLPAGKTCKWYNSTMLQVDFVASNGVPSSITISPNSFHYDYEYSQESADATSVDVNLPPPKLSVVIAGLTMLSECDNLELLANLASPTLYPLVFSWSISFITIGKLTPPQTIAAAKNYFLTFSNFSTLKPVSIASSYYRKDTTINVTLLAKAANQDSDVVSQTVIINILGDIPKVKFSSKSQAVSDLQGDTASVLAMQIANKRCARSSSRRRLQSDSGDNLIPISTDFQIFSGTNLNLMIKSPQEKILEGKLNKMYEKYNILSVDKTQGFQFNKYYKIMAKITNLETDQVNNDTYMFSFIKPAIKSVIDPIGGIVSISTNVILNGGNSSFPDSKGEMINYKWTCLSCTSLAKNASCSCPLFSRARTLIPKLTLQGTSLQNLCRYVFSLTVSATGIGSVRTDSSQIDFITFKLPIRPVIGRIIQGKNNKVKDVYFTFQLSYHGPDSNLLFNWTLIEVKSFDPNSTDYCSEKNAFVAQFLKKLGLDDYDSGGSKDIPIPPKLIPKYLTPTNQRYLGVDKTTLIPQYQYTFAVVVTYPDIPSFIYVALTAPKLPRSRLITLSPITGVGFTTPFSLVYLLPQITDIDKAKYQIYRKDCPSNRKSQAKSLTQVMGQSNLFTATLAPGDAKCKYQVEIILRAIEFDDYTEGSVIATVTTPTAPASQLISKQLAGLVANKDALTVDQTISTLSGLSAVNQTEKSAETTNSVKTMMGLVSTIDIPTGGALTLCDPADKAKVLNTTTNILSNLVNNQAATVDISTAGTVSKKATDYLSIAKKVVDGTSMIPSIVSSLSGAADIGKTNEANPAFYNSHQQALGNMTQMKINETQPNAPPYSVTSPSVEMVVQKNYTDAFDSPQNATSEKGSQLKMPGGLQDQLLADITKTAGQTNNTLAVGTSMSSLSYNPFTNIKKNSAINTTSFPSNSSGELATPATISSIYNDLSKGKLKDVVDEQEQDTDVIQVAFTPSEVQKDSSETLTGKNLIISSLPSQKKAYFSFPTPVKNDSMKSNDTLMVPLFYNPINKQWTNDGCQIDSPIFTSIINVSCSHIGKPVLKGNKVQVVDTAISIVVDVLKDVLNVLRAGNYEALYSFESFLDAPPTNYAVLACVFVFFGLVGLITVRLKKKDRKVLYNERIRTLYKRYGIKPIGQNEGLLKDAFGFISNLKLEGAKITFKNLNTPAKTKDEKSTSVRNAREIKEKTCVSNGFNKLSWMEERELESLFYYYHENTYLFSEAELYKLLFDSIQENKVLTRLTQQRLEDIILDNPTFCVVLKSEHPLVNAVAQPDLKTERPIKTLILASLILGQLFVTGYFFDAKDYISLSEAGKQFLGDSAIIATLCSIMMIPLKLIITLFLGGKQLNNHVTKEELEKFDANQKCYQTIGVVLICGWVAACLYGIMMFIMSFTTEALLKWIVTFLMGIFINNVIIFNVKLILSIVIAVFLLKLARCRLMMTIASSCAGKIVDFLLKFFSQQLNMK